MNNEALHEFDVDEVKKAANKLDVSDRGSDEEYNRVLLAEFAAFARLRRRAMLGQELMDDLMSNEELRELRARYLRGEVGVEEYVNAILNSEDGDRRRRDIMARARQTAAERMLRKAGDKNGWTEPTGT